MTAILVWGPGEVRFRCLSSTGDVLEMSVVIGVGGEWMRELGLGFTNPVGTGGMLDQGLEGWGCLDSLCS